MNKGTKGALLAPAVATLFLATAAMAQDSGAMSSSGSQTRSAKVVHRRQLLQGTGLVQECSERL